MLSHFYITCTALHFTFFIFTFTLSHLVHVLLQTQTTPKIGRDIIPDILSLKTTRAFWRQNILRHFTRSALPLLYSWSDSPIRCSTPLYSRSGSLIGSAYYFLYISFCFRFNKSLMNLTSLRQHHLQYTWTRYATSWHINWHFPKATKLRISNLLLRSPALMVSGY